MGGFSIGIGIGVRRPQGGMYSYGSHPGETSCYATGIWIMSGIYRMDDTWKMQKAQSKTRTTSTRTRQRRKQ